MKNIENKFLPSPFNFTGSKYKLIEELIKYLPKDSTILYDLFCGGGSVFINIENKFQEIHANDIISPLIQFYQYLQITPWENLIQNILSKNIPKNDHIAYSQLRNNFNQNKNFIDFFILISSCTNNMMRFNKKGQFNQTWGKRNFNSSTELKLKEYHNKLYNNNRISFTNKNFYELEIKENSFVYLDPPYFISEAGYNACWNKEKETKLYSFLNELNNRNIKFMMSNVAEHKNQTNPYLHELSKYNIIYLNYNYNKVSREGLSNSKEIIVTNY